jgi:hypothetical protein
MSRRCLSLLLKEALDNGTEPAIAQALYDCASGSLDNEFLNSAQVFAEQEQAYLELEALAEKTPAPKQMEAYRIEYFRTASETEPNFTIRLFDITEQVVLATAESCARRCKYGAFKITKLTRED